jgi:hypothetical protein
MAKRRPGRGARAWQVESVWVKRREGPERVLSAYRLLLDLPPRRALGMDGPVSLPRRQARDPTAAEGGAGAAALTTSDGTSI